MHPRVFQEFERICAARGAGGAVLEIGAVPSADSLLCLRALAGATEKIGVSLDGPAQFAGFRILRGNANALTDFADARFDTVLCNSVLEHDRFFWRTVGEMRRVTRPGGMIVIGVPGYAPRPSNLLRHLARPLASAPGAIGRRIAARLASTSTLVPHHCPGDYYRFSAQAVAEVLLAELVEVRIQTLMHPPRIIGSGRKP